MITIKSVPVVVVTFLLKVLPSVVSTALIATKLKNIGRYKSNENFLIAKKFNYTFIYDFSSKVGNNLVSLKYTLEL